MSFKVRSCLDVFANSVAESGVDNVPLVDHFRRSLAQHLVNQVAILPRLRSRCLRPRYNITAMLRPALLVRNSVNNTNEPIYNVPLQQQQTMFSHLQSTVYQLQ